MLDVKKILVPHDFSEHSDEALSAALRIAEVFGASVHLLHVYHRPVEMFSPYGVEPPVAAIEEIPQAARRRLETEVAKLKEAGVEGDAVVREGLPAVEIVDFGNEIGADLIVMGTRGLTGLKHVLLGSVAERTLRLAECPVLSVKAN